MQRLSQKAGMVSGERVDEPESAAHRSVGSNPLVVLPKGSEPAGSQVFRKACRYQAFFAGSQVQPESPHSQIADHFELVRLYSGDENAPFSTNIGITREQRLQIQNQAHSAVA